MIITRPMLAAPLKDLSKLKYPCLATPKLDGIRCIKVNGEVLSRTFKPIRNRWIVKHILTLPDGVDGEIMTKNFNTAQSVVMTEEGKPDFKYYVFDVAGEKPYNRRVLNIPKLDRPWLVPLVPTVIRTPAAFRKFEEWCLANAFEGVITRSPESPYKCGRSTLREQYMLKYKRFEDAEAIIIGFEELCQNTNEAKMDALGLTKRSSHKAGKKAKDTLGAFVVRDLRSDVVFCIGTGKSLTLKLRKRIWKNKSKYKGAIIKYRYQEHGQKDKPRFPSFQGFRDPEDL